MELEAVRMPTREIEPEEASLRSAEKPTEELSTKPYRVDGGWRAWSNVLASFLQIAIALGPTNAFGIFQAYYKLNMFPDASEMSISFIGSTNQAFLSAGCLATGRLSEIIGLRPVAFMGSILAVVAFLSASWCKSVAALIVTQGIILGLGSACLYVTAATVIGPWFDKKRSLAFGICASGGGVGGLAFSYIFRSLLTAVGLAWTLRISAFICMAILAISLFLMVTPPDVVAARKKGSFVDSLTIFKRERWLIPLYIGFIFYLLGFSVPYFYLASYIQTVGEASPQSGSSISAVLNVGSIFGRILLGLAMDTRLGSVNTFVLGIILTTVLTFAMWLTANGNIAVSYVYAVLYGFFASGALGVSPSVLSRTLGHTKLASIIGLFYTSEIPGFLSGAPIAGAILARGGYSAVINYAGACIAMASVFFVVARLMIDRKLGWTV